MVSKGIAMKSSMNCSASEHLPHLIDEKSFHKLQRKMTKLCSPKLITESPSLTNLCIVCVPIRVFSSSLFQRKKFLISPPSPLWETNCSDVIYEAKEGPKWNTYFSLGPRQRTDIAITM